MRRRFKARGKAENPKRRRKKGSGEPENRRKGTDPMNGDPSVHTRTVHIVTASARRMYVKTWRT